MAVKIFGDGTITGLKLSTFEDVDTSALIDGQYLQWNAADDKWVPEGVDVEKKRVVAFTGSGTWTVPAGVTYAIAHVLGGGGGLATATENDAGEGGSSSVTFATATPTSLGGLRSILRNADHTNAGRANSGRGGRGSYTALGRAGYEAGNAQWVVAGAAVTPAESITVTVGAGGTAGSTGVIAASVAGGSGYVYIEYYEEA